MHEEEEEGGRKKILANLTDQDRGENLLALSLLISLLWSLWDLEKKCEMFRHSVLSRVQGGSGPFGRWSHQHLHSVSTDHGVSHQIVFASNSQVTVLLNDVTILILY